MKKSTFLFVLLLILGVGGICYIHTTVNAQKDKVTLTETVLAGDPSAVEGVMVEVKTHYDNHLFWNTSYKAGSKPITETEYTFSAQSLYEERPTEYRGICLESYMEYGIDLTEDTSELSGLTVAYREIYDALEPGEEMSKIVYIKDYYDFYPIGGYIELPGFRANFGGENTLSTVSGLELYEVEQLQEYFKIPVLKEQTREISIQKGTGNSMGIGGSSTESDEYYMCTYNAVGKDACYFTFDTHSYEGKVMDMSYIPDGYGIYSLPYDTDETGDTSVDVEQLSMVYPLDTDVWILDFQINTEKDKLLLTTQENGILYFTVIGIENMETLQKLEIVELKDTFIMQFANYEDFFAWTFADDRIALVSLDEAGEYQLEFVVETDLSHQMLYYGNTENAMDWNGEQLVVASFIMDEYGYYDTCGFHISVFDKKGLAYCGQYTSSLDTAYGKRHSSRCMPVDYAPISVSWE